MEQEWITDRPPTKADGDRDGLVRMLPEPGAEPEDWLGIHWSYVATGAPWSHTYFWEPPAEPEPAPAEPAPAEPDRIAALEQRVAELEAELCPSGPERIAARRVVRIAGGDDCLGALCNDDSLFQLTGGVWTELPAIPQP